MNDDNVLKVVKRVFRKCLKRESVPKHKWIPAFKSVSVIFTIFALMQRKMQAPYATNCLFSKAQCGTLFFNLSSLVITEERAEQGKKNNFGKLVRNYSPQEYHFFQRQYHFFSVQKTEMTQHTFS